MANIANILRSDRFPSNFTYDQYDVSTQSSPSSEDVEMLEPQPSSNKRKCEAENQEQIQKKQKTSEQVQEEGCLQAGSRELTDEIFLKSLDTIPKLTELDLFLASPEVTDASIEGLKSRVKDVMRFRLCHPEKITEQALSELITQMPQLRSFVVTLCNQVSEVFARSLVHCHHLQELRLCFCDNMTDRVTYIIATSCPNLKILDLGCCDNYTDNAFTQLLGKPNVVLGSLEQIRLNNSPHLTDRGVEAITSIARNTIELNLEMCQHITGDFIRTAAFYLKQLEILDISYCHSVTDSAFTKLENHHLPSLKKLALSDTAVSNQTIEKLAQMELRSFLQNLCCSCEGIDWQALKFFQYFSHLRKLNLYWMNMREPEIPFQRIHVLEPLKKCTQLESLNISGIRISEYRHYEASDVIPIVKELRRLKKLSVINLGNSKEFAELKDVNPELKLKVFN